MSHVTALPAPEAVSFDESATEVAHYAVATFQNMDVADVAVTAVGFLAVARLVYAYTNKTSALSQLWTLVSVVKNCCTTQRNTQKLS